MEKLLELVAGLEAGKEKRESTEIKKKKRSLLERNLEKRCCYSVSLNADLDMAIDDVRLRGHGNKY